MSYHPDEYDLEQSHELERRLDRDAEREPYRYRSPRTRRRPRYFSGLLFRPAASANDLATDERFVSSPMRQLARKAA